jgi:aspartyl protease family protein
MKLWLKFLGYVIGLFFAVLLFTLFGTETVPLEKNMAPAHLEPAVTEIPNDTANVSEPEPEPQDSIYSAEYIASLPQIVPEPEPAQQTLDNDAMVIHGDSLGHFRGRVLINGVSMPFILDTGATTTTVPFELAKKANLPLGDVNHVETANGIAAGQKSRIQEMKLGNAVLKDTEADINYSLDEVLIGMTTLKHFQISVENNTIKLTPNKGYGDEPVSLSATGPKKWRKQVVCDNEGQDCKTVYSESE